MNESVVYLQDCIEGMKQFPDKWFDLAVVDPPYGLGDRLSSGGGKRKDDPSRLLYVDKEWDILPNEEYWKELFRVSNNQAVFGANYFLDYLPNTRGFICWDKKQDMPTLSACELIWTSFDKPAKIYKKSSQDRERFHPTQKPIGIYDYVFAYCKLEKGQKILDTHGGSMSSVISALKNEMEITCFEIDKEYFDLAKKRIENHFNQTNLFMEKPNIKFDEMI